MANQTNQANPANRKDTKDTNRQQGSRGGKKPDIYPPMSRQAPSDSGEYEEEEGMQPVQQSGGSQKGNTMGRAQRGSRPTGNERSERGGFGSGTAQGPSESRFRKTASPQSAYGEEEEETEGKEEKEDE